MSGRGSSWELRAAASCTAEVTRLTGFEAMVGGWWIEVDLGVGEPELAEESWKAKERSGMGGKKKIKDGSDAKRFGVWMGF
jgi:hypothetical protein